MVSSTVTRRPFCSAGRILAKCAIRLSVRFWEHLPSHQWPLQYLHRPSWVTTQEDQSLELKRRKHQFHHRWHGVGYIIVGCTLAFVKPTIPIPLDFSEQFFQLLLHPPTNLNPCNHHSKRNKEQGGRTYMTFFSLGSNFGAVFEVNPHQSATTYSHTCFDEGPRTHDYKWSGITCWLVLGWWLSVSCGSNTASSQ